MTATVKVIDLWLNPLNTRIIGLNPLVLVPSTKEVFC